MTREEFIADHILTCQAGRCLKYDVNKSGSATHTIDYSRRKCAKNAWRKLAKKGDLKCRRWTEDEIKYLGKEPHGVVAQRINRTESACAAKALKLGIRRELIRAESAPPPRRRRNRK